MNCHDFRLLLRQKAEPPNECYDHLDECFECRIWLDKELASPPTGFGEPDFDMPSTRLREDVLERCTSAVSSSSSSNLIKRLFSDFQLWWAFSALSSIAVVVILIMQLKNHSYFSSSLDLKPDLKTSYLEQISFIEAFKFPVTFIPKLGTNELTFLENQEKPNITFLDEEEEKEESWLEEFRS